MAITAAMVKELRERTGLGMMDCKAALTEAGGDMELAIEELRKSSGMKAAKKAGRTAADGVVAVKVADDGSYLFSYVPAGAYTLAFSCDAEDDDHGFTKSTMSCKAIRHIHRRV